MNRYILNRLAQIPVVIAIMTVLLFVVVRLLPGDPALARLGVEGGGTNDAYAALQVAMELDKPITHQYGEWVISLVKLDLGSSLISNEDVGTSLMKRLPVSTELGLLALAFGIGFGVPLAIVSAFWSGKFWDGAARTVAVAGLSIPIFWTATLLLLFLSLEFQWIPPVQYHPIWEDPWANLQQIGIAALILSFPLMGQVARVLRLSILEQLREPYVQGAYAKGASRIRVLNIHVLKNALIPVVTLLGATVSFLVGGVVVTETIFSIPGMGSLLIESLRNNDYPVFQGVLLVVGLAVILANLAVDISYAWFNPRIRAYGDAR